MPFNLENAIANWRRRVEHNRAFLNDDVEELECHLRDYIDAQVERGIPEGWAFAAALSRLGDYGIVEREYRKTRWAKIKHIGMRRQTILAEIIMILNYSKVAFRNLCKHTGYAVINTVGLAVGIACCLLILRYVQFERSYDRYHADADKIYRIVWMNDNPQTRVPHPMAQAIVRDFPQVESAVSISPLWGPGLTRPTFSVQYLDRRFDEGGLMAADSTLFDVFTFPFVAGDPFMALRQPGGIVLTRDMAAKYFNDEDPLGEILLVDDQYEVTVMGVIENIPETSHFHFDALFSYVTLKAGDPDPFYEWGDFGHYNYIRLREGADPKTLENDLPEWSRQYIDWSEEAMANMQEGLMGFRLQPLTDIHLHSNIRWELEPNGDIAHVYTFSLSALFILLIACINFMNLATARSMDRAKEVGIRKALGANRPGLMRQFLSESIMLSFFALLVAVVLFVMILPSFNTLAGTNLAIDWMDTRFWILLVGTVLLVGFASGGYPAFVIASFQPVQVLKGKIRSNRYGAILRKGLVIFQFTISIVLISGTLVTFQQLSYLRHRNLGFEKDQVVVIPITEETMRERYLAVKEELIKHPDVLYASTVSNIPGGQFNQNPIQWVSSEGPVTMSELRVDHDFFATLDIPLKEGRLFSADFPADVENAYVLNETAVRQFDWESALGEELIWFDDDSTRRALVIGVVKDFHFKSLHQTIDPLIIQVLPDEFNYMLVKVRPERITETISFLEEQWTTFDPEHTFSYSFLDQEFEALYQADQRTGHVLIVFSLLAIFVACLGLFGLASFITAQRTKEIGVRKILGASTAGIVLLLTQSFTRLILVAIVIAVPIGYVTLNRWLQNFAYRIEISWLIFLIAGLSAFIIALVTVSYQSIKAAVADPVNSLRYE